ncbi:MAG: hypothetical protein LBM13_00960 [Candidatus Ancillula sp.]|jgi:hypothetical protein|nr:hypothetical protein [Candidatus Ancillula sp.]
MVRIIDSARKHDISDEDIMWVYYTAHDGIQLSEEPEKFMLFGFDTKGIPLEVGYFVNEDNEIIIMHAMKLRKSYYKYLFKEGLWLN